MRLIDADALVYELTEMVRHSTGEYKNGIAVARLVAMDAPTIGDWISVNDRLPNAAETVLFTGTNLLGERFHAQTGYYNLGVWVADSIGIVNPTFTITHWMPLPELPKENS